MSYFLLAISKVSPILINIELLEQIATVGNNKKHHYDQTLQVSMIQ
jgi:hypothetical protein